MTESSDFTRDQHLDEAVAEYLKMRESGQTIDQRAWLAQYPDLADELAEFIRDLEQLSPVPNPLETDAQAASGYDHNQTLPATRTTNAITASGFESSKTSARRYRVRDFLAAGGMGEVWLAEDTHIGRKIAVKKIRNSQFASAASKARFIFESQVMGQLEHPCIVPLHDLGQDETGNLFSVMKLVKGSSLKQRLLDFHANMPDDWTTSVEFRRMLEAFVSICHAVAYAHSRGVLHRDIKPDNIMLGSYGEAMLLDWGLAKSLNSPDGAIDPPPSVERVRLSTGNSSATQAGAVMGSPVYMSPEVAAGESDAADERTDVYLLGATLYEILTGKPPRSGTSAPVLIELAKRTPPPPPRSLDRTIPPALDAICQHAMAHARDQRYPSAQMLAGDIERFLAGDSVSVYREPLTMRVYRWCRRHHRMLTRAAALSMFLGLTSAAILNYRHATSLKARETSRTQLDQFRRLADDVQFFAANTDADNERTPYYDPERGLQLGNQALTAAAQFNDDGSQLPLTDERIMFREEMEALLLVLANLHLQSAGIENLDTARSLLDRAEKLRPRSRAVHRLRALRDQRIGADDREALEIASTADDESESDALDWFIEGELKRKRVDAIDDAIVAPRGAGVDAASCRAAIEAYQQALTLHPEHYWARYQLARCYLRLQRGGEALEALGACIALRPDSPWAYSTRGLTQALLGNFEQAESDLDQAIRLQTDFQPARLNRGILRVLQNRDDEALAELGQILPPEAEPGLIEAAFYRSQIHMRRRDYRAALEDCERFLAERPHFSPALSLHAGILFSLGQNDRAVESIDRIIAAMSTASLPPNVATQRLLRGRALRDLAMTVDAATQATILRLALKELESVDPQAVENDVTAIRDLLGLSQEVTQIYSSRLAVAPNDLDARVKRGWNYIAQRRYDLALDDFEVALSQSPVDPEAYTGLGYARAMRGERPLAELAAVNAMIHGSASYLILHNVACIYAELADANPSSEGRRSDEDRAIRCLSRAVVISRQLSDGVDEVELIRNEPAFHESLRQRPEFAELLK